MQQNQSQVASVSSDQDHNYPSHDGNAGVDFESEARALEKKRDQWTVKYEEMVSKYNSPKEELGEFQQETGTTVPETTDEMRAPEKQLRKRKAPAQIPPKILGTFSREAIKSPAVPTAAAGFSGHAANVPTLRSRKRKNQFLDVKAKIKPEVEKTDFQQTELHGLPASAKFVQANEDDEERSPVSELPNVHPPTKRSHQLWCLTLSKLKVYNPPLHLSLQISCNLEALDSDSLSKTIPEKMDIIQQFNQQSEPECKIYIGRILEILTIIKDTLGFSDGVLIWRVFCCAVEVNTPFFLLAKYQWRVTKITVHRKTPQHFCSRLLH